MRYSRHRRQPNRQQEQGDKQPFFSRSSERTPFFQPKLKVGEPGDKFEQEADAMANAVVNQPSANAPAVQRKEGGTIQRESLATPQEDEKLGTAEQRQEKDKMLQTKPELQMMGEEKEEPAVQTMGQEEEKGNMQMMGEEEEKSAPGAQMKGEEEEKGAGVQMMSEEKEEPSVQTMGEEEEKSAPGAQMKGEEEEKGAGVQMMGEEKEEPSVQTMGEEEDKSAPDAQMMGEAEEKEEGGAPAMQTKREPGRGGVANQALTSKVERTRGNGKPLPNKAKAEMEAGFGVDFSGVNIHTDQDAVEMNKGLRAQAFTHGKDIYFNTGKFNPDTSDGKRLLAHELTHTIQQKGAEIKKKGGGANNLKSPRFRGDSILEGALDGTVYIKSGSSGTAVVRLQQALVDAGFPLPKFGIDGKFGSETKKALRAYQKANALSADGIVGPKTMAALDLYYSVDRGKDPLPPEPGSKEESLLAILKKGDKMSKPEAQKAQKLLFELNGDDFKRALKAAIENKGFRIWLGKLGILKLLAALSKTTTEVVIPTTLLKPAANVIDADFTRANQIFNPHGIEVEKGNAKVLSEKESKKVIGNDLILDEFTTNAATAEELELIKHNRVKGRITGYWVPDMTSSRGEGLIKSDLSNMPDDRTSVVTNSKSRAQDTFAHEVGHALGLDHTESDSIADTTSGDPNNLMTSGSNRKIAGAGIDKLTAGQLAVIRKSLFVEIGKKE